MKCVLACAFAFRLPRSRKTPKKGKWFRYEVKTQADAQIHPTLLSYTPVAHLKSGKYS